MVTNEINAPMRTTTAPQRRFKRAISGFTVRLLIAFAISWLIILVFFVSLVISR